MVHAQECYRLEGKSATDWKSFRSYPQTKRVLPDFQSVALFLSDRLIAQLRLRSMNSGERVTLTTVWRLSVGCGWSGLTWASG